MKPGMRFGRFAVVGMLGAAIQLFLFALFVERFRFSPLTSTAIAVEIALLHNFIWHERFTWRDRDVRHSVRQRAMRLQRFHAGNGLVSLLGNSVITYCLREGWNIPPMIAAACSIALCSAANFAISDRWVYGLSRER